jgi:hypothetical protein
VIGGSGPAHTPHSQSTIFRTFANAFDPRLRLGAGRPGISNMRILGIVALTLLHPSVALATAISDPTARLACFDAPPKAAARKATPKPPDEFAAAKAAMTRKLTDPESARFDQLFKVTTDNGEAVCSLANSKNRMGGLHRSDRLHL